MKKLVFTGAGVALVTPFIEDGSAVDYDKFAELIEEQIAGKTDALLIAGTTGESPTLSDEEHRGIISFAVRQVAGRVPVIAGAGSNDTLYSAHLARHAQDAGVDALLLVSPYYNKTTQKGLVKHFTYVADRVDIPIILYNIPGRTGVDIKPETYAELAKHPNIVATKEANGNISALVKTRALVGDELYVYSGDDDLTVPMLSLGGKGVISVLSNLMPKYVHDICESYFTGDVKKSMDMALKASPLVQALFSEVNPGPVKTAMNLMGKKVGPLRLPLCDMDSATLANLKAQMARFELIKE
ncbi:MAG: 4-hydroxy-tetrahydrodipicolinate synthase [Eubacteriales bacterium]|nr:4-hydroxy-tetrahydrodipicolinate synthase [Eubacteriales bacterium]MDD3880968.1 4-hydroxy-tetrahydrodipicolinate synthase [Eubacteriales bacterium]MDD4511963.1 4-hydroxy-tetrahydrodipicolinate synthase [Eubacteriales bacterium]